MMVRMPTADRYNDADLATIYTRFAPWYRWVSLVNDSVLGVAALRRWVMAEAHGDVLDVACGTGENFRHLRSVDSLTAVDLTPAMLERAAHRAARLGLVVELRTMSAQYLDLPDGAFDTVTTAMSTCTFPDPVGALREMARVTRPGGRILVVEHGRSRVGWIARLQHRRAAKHYRQIGCRWDQDVRALLDEAGLEVEVVRTRTLGAFTAAITRPSRVGVSCDRPVT